ncbi:MAG: TraR/DksA family transcriptional regulator [Planctomycetaceae bacterium]|nr:TraR/DksA family transcriptional regulator [Planctomycetaceae bacterium]
MTPEKFRSNLIALRDCLTNDQASTRDTLKHESARLTARAPINMAEQASDSQELDMMVSRLNASSEALAEIDEALDRIDAGQFNVCEECKGEIGERRLTIQPWAKFCVKCQRKLEEDDA